MSKDFDDYSDEEQIEYYEGLIKHHVGAAGMAGDFERMLLDRAGALYKAHKDVSAQIHRDLATKAKSMATHERDKKDAVNRQIDEVKKRIEQNSP